MRFALRQLTNPPYEPVSLSLVKEWLKVDDTSLDTICAQLIKALREDAENLTLRCFVPRQFKLTLERFPADCAGLYGYRIELPNPPLISVASVKYIDTNGTLQTMDPTLYVVHDEYEPGFIVPAYLQVWPPLRTVPDAVQVTYNAGYSPGSPQDEQGYQDSIPEKLKLWMEAKCATLEQNREQLVRGTIVAKIPRDFSDSLLDSLIVGTRLF